MKSKKFFIFRFPLLDLLHKSELTADFRRYTQIFYLLLVILSAFIGENLRLILTYARGLLKFSPHRFAD